MLSNKEHLIGRNFVPTGRLRGDSFNFLFRACVDCNAIKAKAEGHVSGVTLFNSQARTVDPEVDLLAKRKASKEIHPLKPGVPIADSGGRHDVQVKGDGITMNFGLTSPPQLDPYYSGLLAGMQVQALYSLITTADSAKFETGWVLPGDRVRVYGMYNAQDWGNPRLREIERRVEAWPCHLNITAAEGYYQALMRRSEDDVEGWFWALEWNRFLRIVGSINIPTGAPQLFEGLPPLGWQPLPDGTGRIRTEVPLPDGEDTLFSALVAGVDC